MRLTGPCVQHLAEVFRQSTLEAYAHDRTTWLKLYHKVKMTAKTHIQHSSVYNQIYDYISAKQRNSHPFFGNLTDRLPVPSSTHPLSPPAYTPASEPTAPTLRQRAAQSLHSVAATLDILGQSTQSAETWRRWRKMRKNIKREWSNVMAKIRQVTHTPPSIQSHSSDVAEVTAAAPSSSSSKRLPSTPLQSIASTLDETLRNPSSLPTVSTTPTSPSSAPHADTTQQPPDSHSNLYPDTFVQIFPSNTLREQFTIQQSLIDVLQNACDYVLIVNPFLLPPHKIKQALIACAKRGVKVRMIVR